MICKCKECTKRYIGCHSKCEDYKKFAESIKKENDARRYDKMCYQRGWGYIPSRKERFGKNG